jgi:O-antigen/teichoic acid export membrane protein
LSTARVIARNILSNWANLSINIVIGFFMLPFLVHRLGDTMYGVWALVVSLVGYGNLLDLGVRSSIVKYVSQYHATQDQHRLKKLYTTAFWVYISIGVLVLALSILASLLLPRMVAIPAELKEDAQVVLVIVGLSIALKFPAGVFEGVITGLQRYELANGISIGFTLLRTALIVAALLNDQKLVALAVAGLLTDALMMLAMAISCRRLLPSLALGAPSLDRTTLRTVYSFGVWSAAIALATRVLYESDAILIGLYLPAVAITQFAVANSLVRYLRQFAYGFGNVFSPAASGLQANFEDERLRNLLVQGTRYASTLIVPAAALLAIFGRDFLALWMGARFASESGMALMILVLSQALVMAQFPAGSILYGLNRHRYLAMVLLGGAAAKIAISAALLPVHGVVGAAWGTAIPEILASVVFVPLLVTRFAQVSLGRYVRGAIAPAIASVIPMVAFALWVRTALPPTSWLALVTEVFLALLIYAAIAARLCLDSSQRQSLYAALHGRLGRSE